MTPTLTAALDALGVLPRADHVDALLKAEREKALREAANVCERIRTQQINGPMPERACFDYEQSILALISEDATNG